MRELTILSSTDPKISFFKVRHLRSTKRFHPFIHFILLTAALKRRNAGVISFMLLEARDKCVGQVPKRSRHGFQF